MPNNIDKAPVHEHGIGWSRYATHYRKGDIDPPHHHTQGQLLYATRGVMLVEAGEHRWVIPPQRALWIPPLQEHAYTLLSATDLRTIYFDVELIAGCDNFSRHAVVHVINATPLIKELVAGLFDNSYQEGSHRAMAMLLLNILSETEQPSAELPMPKDERLNHAVREMIAGQRWEASLSDLAALAAMSERTFTRLFTRDTGFSFRRWKQRARIYASLDLLTNGAPIKQVAWQLGFSGPAAFAAAFRAVLGVPPHDYLA